MHGAYNFKLNRYFSANFWGTRMGSFYENKLKLTKASNKQTSYLRILQNWQAARTLAARLLIFITVDCCSAA